MTIKALKMMAKIRALIRLKNNSNKYKDDANDDNYNESIDAHGQNNSDNENKRN